MPLRLAIVTEIPTPYRAPLFDELARRGTVAPHVLYLVRREVLRGAWAVDCAGHEHEHLGGGAVTFRGLRGPFSWKWTRGVARRLDELRPDAVVVSGWAHGAMHAASRWARRRGVPSLVWSESHPRMHRFPLRTWVRDRVAGPLVSRASAWLPVSSRAQLLLERLGADASRCFVVPNAPPVDRFTQARADAAARAATRASLGAGEESLTIFVGRLIPAKAIDTLIAAAAAMGNAPLLWIIGGGPLLTRLTAKAQSLGIASRVRFLGDQSYDRVISLCAAADVVALPSVHEPYGVALHEGMAAGCAALASDAVGAAGDLVVEGESGHVVPAGDVSALAAAWSDLLSDRARLARWGRKAAERAAARGIPFAASQIERAAAAALGSSAPAHGVV